MCAETTKQFTWVMLSVSVSFTGYSLQVIDGDLLGDCQVNGCRDDKYSRDAYECQPPPTQSRTPSATATRSETFIESEPVNESWAPVASESFKESGTFVESELVKESEMFVESESVTESGTFSASQSIEESEILVESEAFVESIALPERIARQNVDPGGQKRRARGCEADESEWETEG
jgi:hypothetical protein